MLHGNITSLKERAIDLGPIKFLVDSYGISNMSKEIPTVCLPEPSRIDEIVKSFVDSFKDSKDSDQIIIDSFPSDFDRTNF